MEEVQIWENSRTRNRKLIVEARKEPWWKQKGRDGNENLPTGENVQRSGKNVGKQRIATVCGWKKGKQKTDG